MSLINQMLKDLEQRRPQDAAATGEPSLQGVDPAVGPAAPRRSRKALVLAVTLVLLLLAGFSLFWWWGGSTQGKLSQDLPEQRPAAPQAPPVAAAPEMVSPVAPPPEPLVAVAEQPVVEPPAVAAPVKNSGGGVQQQLQPMQAAPAVEARPQPAAVAVIPAVLKNLRINEQRGHLRLVFYFDRIPTFRLSRHSGDRGLILDLAETRLTGRLPYPPSSSLLKGIEVLEETGDLKLALKFKTGFRYLESVENSARDFGKRLVVDLYPKSRPEAEVISAAPISPKGRAAAPASQPALSVAEGQVAKVLLGDTQASEAERAFLQASAALGRNDWPAAERLLRRALNLDGEHLQAREVLAGRLLQVGRISEAFSLLAEGLRLQPEHLAFRKPYARLLVDQGAIQEALQTLLRGELPAVQADPEAHALLAAIYQQLGEYSLAVRTYRQLVGVKPDSGLWWMGLAIAQEGEGQGGEALQAYRRALASGSLRADLKAYVHQRYRELEARGQ